MNDINQCRHSLFTILVFSHFNKIFDFSCEIIPGQDLENDFYVCFHGSKNNMFIFM